MNRRIYKQDSVSSIFDYQSLVKPSRKPINILPRSVIGKLQATYFRAPGVKENKSFTNNYLAAIKELGSIYAIIKQPINSFFNIAIFAERGNLHPYYYSFIFRGVGDKRARVKMLAINLNPGIAANYFLRKNSFIGKKPYWAFLSHLFFIGSKLNPSTYWPFLPLFINKKRRRRLQAIQYRKYIKFVSCSPIQFTNTLYRTKASWPKLIKFRPPRLKIGVSNWYPVSRVSIASSLTVTAAFKARSLNTFGNLAQVKSGLYTSSWVRSPRYNSLSRWAGAVRRGVIKSTFLGNQKLIIPQSQKRIFSTLVNKKSPDASTVNVRFKSRIKQQLSIKNRAKSNKAKRRHKKYLLRIAKIRRRLAKQVFKRLVKQPTIQLITNYQYFSKQPLFGNVNFQQLKQYHYLLKVINRRVPNSPAIIQYPLLKLWGRLINNSKYYGAGRLLNPLAAQKVQVQNYHHYTNREFYNRQFLVHSIDISRFNTIVFRPYPSSARVNWDPILALIKPSQRRVTQIPLYYNPIYNKIRARQPWMMFSKDQKRYDFFYKPISVQTLIIVEPYRNYVYYINLNVVKQINFNIINLSGKTIKKRRKWFETYKLWYNIKRPICICFIHLFNSYSFTNLKYFPRDEYYIKNGLPSSYMLQPSKQPSVVSFSSLTQVSLYIDYVLRLLSRPKKISIVSKKRQILINGAIKYSKLLHKLLIYEYRAFKWKFFKQRWFFQYSRWGRSIKFKKAFNKAATNYRRLSKEFLFLKVFKSHLKTILGIDESNLYKHWQYFRHGFNSNINNALERFYLSLYLRLDNFLLIIGLAPNQPVATELIRSGMIRLNGVVLTNANLFIKPADSIQFELSHRNNFVTLYSRTSWKLIKIKSVPFICALWSIMLFKLLRWPNAYEITEASLLDIRWIRYYIRQLPIKKLKYIKIKDQVRTN